VRGVALAELFAEADFISLHVALTAETRGLIDARALAAMKPGVVLVNTARGGVVDEPALVQALESGQLGAVGLDVFESEPLDDKHPLLGFPNAVLTPHIGSASVETRVRMVDLAVANLLAGLRGEPLPACANPDVQR
jgi:glyoxylate reductase